MKIYKKFYIIYNNNWIETELTPDKLSYRWINLYDDNLKIYGIGMYKKQSLK